MTAAPVLCQIVVQKPSREACKAPSSNQNQIKKGEEATNARQKICKPKKGTNKTPSRCEEGVSLTEVDQKQESKMQQVWVWGIQASKCYV
jgi:hypothetical protein